MAQDLIFEYFCRPIIDSGVQGYNFVNTSAYALILFAVVVFWLWPFLKKNSIKFNFKFALSLLPFVVFGSALRVLNDMGIFAKTCSPIELNFYTFTPGIWFLTAALAIIALIIAKKFSKNEEMFHKYFAAIGIVAAAPLLVYEFTVFKAWDGFALVAAAVIAITFATKFIVEAKWKGFFSDRLNLLVVAGQALDGSATYVATNVFTCGEQHPLSGAILGASPLLFPLVKVVLALLIIYYVDKDIEDKNF
ncbi:MAG TPA: DUF63 family protein, partial [archaeon]|nr:DUF63 family protein [archaeon]